MLSSSSSRLVSTVVGRASYQYFQYSFQFLYCRRIQRNNFVIANKILNCLITKKAYGACLITLFCARSWHHNSSSVTIHIFSSRREKFTIWISLQNNPLVSVFRNRERHPHTLIPQLCSQNNLRTVFSCLNRYSSPCLLLHSLLLWGPSRPRYEFDGCRMAVLITSFQCPEYLQFILYTVL